MGAIVPVESRFEPGAGAGPRPAGGGGRRYALPALLVAGWAGLFAYAAAYLTEDMPFRAAPEAGQPTEAARPDAPAPRVIVLDAPAAPAARGGGAAAAPAVAEPSTVPLAASTPRPATAPAAPDYVGVWGPTAAACGARSRRRGYIPATITADGARAGRTLCGFRDGHRAGNAWVMAAACSDRGRRWTSQVRLVVDGERLTWSSGRGTATYVRCPRRAG